jgi:hypothetical protein
VVNLSTQKILAEMPLTTINAGEALELHGHTRLLDRAHNGKALAGVILHVID